LIVCVGAIARLRRQRPARADGAPQRILVIRLDLLGDVLHSMTAVAALRAAFPNARIVMLTLPYTAQLARLYPQVDEVVTVDTNRIRRPSGLLNPFTWREYASVRQRLRDERFDLALSLYGRMGSLWAFLSGADRTVGYGDEAYPLLLTHPVPGGRHDRRMSEVDYLLRLVCSIAPVSDPGHLDIPLSNHLERRGKELLAAAGVEDGATVIVIHAGAVNGSAKRWPAASWRRFAEILAERVPVRIALVGAASDAPIARDVVRGCAAPLVDLVGKTSIEELLGILAQADLVTSGDSGPLHLAVALGRPVLAVYGPTDPAIYGPSRPISPATILRADLPCSPCYTLASTAECPLGDPICMRLVSVESMVRSAERLLLR
jgi:lipopolysaccharide heptosyltransferase II